MSLCLRRRHKAVVEHGCDDQLTCGGAHEEQVEVTVRVQGDEACAASSVSQIHVVPDAR